MNESFIESGPGARVSFVKLLSELEPTRFINRLTALVGAYTVPGIDIRASLARSKADIEALVAANKRVFTGLHAVMKREGEMLWEAFEQSAHALNEMPKAPDVGALTEYQAGVVMQAFAERLARVRALAELTIDANNRALAIINARINKDLSELQESENDPSLPLSEVAREASAVPQEKFITPEQRWMMIREAAYYRAEKRGFVGDNLAEDWAAAEADIDANYTVDLTDTMERGDPITMVEELQKGFGGPRFAGVNIAAALESQREDLEALALMNKNALQGARLLIIRQAEILHKTLLDAAASAKVLLETGSGGELVAQHEQIIATARKRALLNMRELAATMAKTHEEILRTSEQHGTEKRGPTHD